MVCALALVAGGPSLAQAANPDFDLVVWSPLTCDASPLTALDPSRPEIDLVGDATFPAAYIGQDSTYLFFRYRVDGDPTGRHGFATMAAWTTLLQVPSGNAFQYQYQLSLNGDALGGDTIEVWANPTAEDLTFDPLFTDLSDTLLFSQVHDLADASTVNTTPLARLLLTGDGSNFNDTPDYFIDVAFPISVLLAQHVIASAAELDRTIFFPATASSAWRHNKDVLACRFLPLTTLALSETVTPATVPANTTTPVRYTIAVRNAGTETARGVVLTQPALPPYLSTPTVTVSADDPDVTWTLVSASPLEVRVPTLPVGKTVTVELEADAMPTCADTSTVTATASATNADPTSASVSLPLGEICDGADNDCDSEIDEGGNALCDDHSVCTGTETCGGAAGCQAGTPLDCDDGDECTADACDPTDGCSNTPIAGCGPCQTDPDPKCDDGDVCTADTCMDGTCTHSSIPNCCTTAADCADDGDPCTDEMCNASNTCERPRRQDCCTAQTDCDDHDPCTVDQCPGAGQTCVRTQILDCKRCTTATECGDGNQCTDDLCRDGRCDNVPIPGCTVCVPVPEVCGDGLDDDCDGLVDCADPDCAGGPGCPQPEACGNCVDDDADGLVDAEDPDCCAEPMALGVERLMLRPGDVKVRGNRLRLAAQYASATPPLFDPLRQDTTIQLSDPAGEVFCTTIPATRWRRARRLTYHFADRAGKFAGGLDAGEFRINRSGNLLVGLRGRGVALRELDPGNVRLTVRVGRECSSSTMALRPGRKGLVYP